jgi:hypothetical protein
MATIEELFEQRKQSIPVAKDAEKTTTPSSSSLDELFKERKNNLSRATPKTDVKEGATVKDILASVGQGALKGVTYLIDLPQTVVDVGDYVTGKAVRGLSNVISKVRGEDPNEYAARIKKIEDLKREVKDNNLLSNIAPGTAFREQFLTYKPKSNVGRYLETAGEYAAPGGLLGRASQAGKLMATTGAISGLVEEGAKDITGSGAVGTGVGIATNIALDIAALRRGDVSGLVKTVQPGKEVVEQAQKVQTAAKSKGLDLTAGEASGTRAIQDLEATIAANPQGAKIFDDFYETRPQQIKTYVSNVAKEFGFITDPKLLSPRAIGLQEKKAAVYLRDQRQKLWEKSGGLAFKETEFASKDVNKVVSEIDNIISKSTNKNINKDVQYFKELIKGKNTGGDLHDAYKEIREVSLAVSQNPNKTISDIKLKKVADEILNSMDSNIFSKNKDFINAQSKYKKFTKVYIEPIEEAKLFKDINVAGWANNMDTYAKVIRYIQSDKLTPRGIEKIAKSFSKSGNPQNFNLIVSSYFDDAISKSFTDTYGSGANIGVQIHKAIVGSPKSRENFTEIVYQLAKSKNKSVSKANIKEAVESFSDVLRATGRSAKIGSPTASRQEMNKLLSNNAVSSVAGTRGGLPVISSIDNFFAQRTLSQNSKLLAKKLTSDEGINAFIDLAENYKDPARVLAIVKGFIMLGSEM